MSFEEKRIVSLESTWRGTLDDVLFNIQKLAKKTEREMRKEWKDYEIERVMFFIEDGPQSFLDEVKDIPPNKVLAVVLTIGDKKS